MQRAPGRGVARMAREFGAPQECCSIGNFLLWSAAVPIERDGVVIESQRFSPVAGLDLTKREMPAQMAIEKAFPRISGEPRGEKGARRIKLAALIANMSEAMGTMGIVRVRRHGSLDLRPRVAKLPILGQGHGVIGDKPEIVAIVGGQAVHQSRDLVLLSDAAGAAN